MKLWECSRDLVTFLDDAGSLAGKHVLELGCGAAIPAVFCLLRGAETVTVQDYVSRLYGFAEGAGKRGISKC